MQLRKKFFLGTLVFFVSQTVFAGGWNAKNNPALIAKETGKSFEYSFSKLPTEGSLSKKPWADDYWPTYKRGLAHRWQGDLVPVQHAKEKLADFEIRKKKERFFTKEEISFMSESERNKLSPAEKMDIVNGDYNYSLTRSELNRTSEDAPKWEGICHGWAAAAMSYDEPGSCKVKIDGNFITGHQYMPFATSDIKALLSLMQGNYAEDTSEVFAGTRCNATKSEIDWENSDHKNDINAGAFHIIMANRLALLDKGFVFDRTVDSEVWNQPVEGFKSKVISEQAPDLTLAAPGTKKEILVQTVVSYTVEVSPHEGPLNGDDRTGFVVDQPYEYILELDGNDKIIGGRWTVEDHPDFVWMQTKSGFNGPFKKLKRVYNKATNRWFFE